MNVIPPCKASVIIMTEKQIASGEVPHNLRFSNVRSALGLGETAQIDVAGAAAGHLVVCPCLLHRRAPAVVVIDENFDAAVGTVAIDRLGAEIANHVCL